MLTKYHGNISVETTKNFILPGLNSGNLQAVIYDLSNQWEKLKNKGWCI
jgi:hypothetical protein